MPEKRIQVSCPNCRTPQLIEAQQVFDVQQDPSSKQRLLSGMPNGLLCSSCGYQGPVGMPLVYHDAEKELLLTFVPPELGLPMHEQERVIGPLIKQVVDNLPAEKRKAYLLQPRTMLSMQTMVETILEGDGITKEALESQQARVQLLQRLANLSSDDSIQQVAKEEDELIDQEFFSILSMLVSNALNGGDEALARRLVEVQQLILPVTTYGKEVQAQAEEMQAASDDLKSLGENLTRETLLDLAIKAPSDTRLRAYVSMTRPGMDYEFFQLLSDRIDRASEQDRPHLVDVREKLLDLTRQYDEQLAAQSEQVKQLVDALLEEDDPGAVLRENPSIVDDLFLQVLEKEIETARQKGDLRRGAKLQQLVEVIENLSTPPPEVDVINQLVTAEDEDARQSILQSLPPDQLQSVLEMMVNLIPQVENSGDASVQKAVKEAYQQALRHSMALNLKR